MAAPLGRFSSAFAPLLRLCRDAFRTHTLDGLGRGFQRYLHESFEALPRLLLAVLVFSLFGAHWQNPSHLKVGQEGESLAATVSPSADIAHTPAPSGNWFLLGTICTKISASYLSPLLIGIKAKLKTL
jgi:hypothetical protein